MEKEGVRWLSPSIVISRNHYFLHVPVREPVYDARKLKQRITDRANICAIQFTNRDAFAVACILNAEGDQLSVRYFKGGAQYRSQSSPQAGRKLVSASPEQQNQKISDLQIVGIRNLSCCCKDISNKKPDIHCRRQRLTACKDYREAIYE